MKIYHNPRCKKSREALDLLKREGQDPEIIEYLKELLTHQQLKVLLAQLSMKAEDVVRKNEAIYKEKYKGKVLTENEWIAAMIQNPKLIERPIVVSGNKAVLGRPPQNVLKLLI